MYRVDPNVDVEVELAWWCWGRLQLAYYFCQLEIADRRLVEPNPKLLKIDTLHVLYDSDDQSLLLWLECNKIAKAKWQKKV
jgi:hypothetical protein